MVFVFGSNLAGRHGKGAALAARRLHGAQYGVGTGPTGNAYAIPTKDAHRTLRVLPLEEINKHVVEFVRYAKTHPELQFDVTRIGCGYAGYCDADIAPMFAGAPANCMLPDGWRELSDKPTDKQKPRPVRQRRAFQPDLFGDKP